MEKVQGPWPDHVQSWRNCPHPNLFIKYEDLLEDPEKTFAHVVNFLTLDFSQERLSDAVKWSSFERMKTLEEEAKFGGNDLVSVIFTGGVDELKNEHAFMNKGLSGQSLDHLGDDIEPAFLKKFGDAMASMGCA